MSKAIERQNWAEFLSEFSERNHDRRARFHIFRNGEMNEEEQEGRFQSASFENGGDGSSVVVTRTYTEIDEEKTMVDTIENVRGLAVQFEKDKSENILEITNNQNHLFSLRFESNIDGVS
ncbi:MAG TPA: hypothetical protein PKY59_06430 [Pyrinomonadaceae bacterium]|nr:hypothetical protein [Pyrinomonadaceae bacterium]